MSYPAGPPLPPKANRSLGVLIIVAVALIAVCVVLGCIGVVTDDRAKDAGIGEPIIPTANAPAVKGAPAPATVPPPAPKARAIEPADLKLSVKTTTKQCFGSAGCNVTFKIKLSIDGDLLAASGRDWAVTYEVRGIEGGPQIGELTLHDDGTFEQDGYQFGQTPSRSTKLTAKATDVEPTL